MAGRPSLLIDVIQCCLVQAEPGHEYMALSYVWGKVSGLKLTHDNLRKLQTWHALDYGKMADMIPNTVRHAIDLVRSLGGRYLWIDMLCIVQDDTDDHKLEELNKMGDIYRNACLTIIAADGAHADHGLCGIRELFLPLKRDSGQCVFSLGDHGDAVGRIFPAANERDARHQPYD